MLAVVSIEELRCEDALVLCLQVRQDLCYGALGEGGVGWGGLERVAVGWGWGRLQRVGMGLYRLKWAAPC